jgi:hypothetical protein
MLNELSVRTILSISAQVLCARSPFVLEFSLGVETQKVQKEPSVLMWTQMANILLDLMRIEPIKASHEGERLQRTPRPGAHLIPRQSIFFRQETFAPVGVLF